MADDPEHARLTDEELEVLDKIGQAYYSFAALPEYHPSDHDEYRFHIHAMGRIVLARAAVRAHPERNWMRGSGTPVLPRER